MRASAPSERQADQMAAITMLLVLNILLLLCSRAAGFQSPASCRTAVCVQGTTSSEPTSSASEATKTLLSFGKAGLFAAALLSAQSASAKVFFDTDVYGDKELKIATVNKMKQKLRNAILKDITVAPELVKLAISDALGFDIASGEGGPNGSILFEKDRAEDASLKRALDLVLGVKKELQRTNTVSLADVVAFAGAEALETVGCSRITVQVGRVDAKSADARVSIPWDDESSSGAVLAALTASGLGVTEAVVLLGALGEVSRVAAETAKAAAEAKAEEEDEEFEPTPFVPTSFGARDAMYGAKMGKADFGSKYFKALLKGQAGGGVLVRLVAEEPAAKALVQKYATTEPAFVKDVAEIYLRLGLVGAAYTTRNS